MLANGYLQEVIYHFSSFVLFERRFILYSGLFSYPNTYIQTRLDPCFDAIDEFPVS
jgi:hypothetical protein